jgi:AraC-like DNA-binding protein
VNLDHPLRKSFFESIFEILPVDRLFDGVPDIVFFVKDAHGRYMAVNDTLAHRCGLSGKDHAIGKTVEELYPPSLGDAFAKQDQKIIACGNGIRDHLELHLYPGGRRGWCLTYKEPMVGRDKNIIGICGISRDLHTPDTQDGDYAAMSHTLEYIHSHFDEPLRLPALSEMAGLSVYQFDQRIRSLFHVTAGQYLVKVRIDAACKCLSGSKAPICQIALDCGYSDQSAFSRQFKQAVGMSPMAYRNRFLK